MTTGKKDKRRRGSPIGERPDKKFPCTIPGCAGTFDTAIGASQHILWHEDKFAAQESLKRRKANRDARAWRVNPIPRPLPLQLRFNGMPATCTSHDDQAFFSRVEDLDIPMKDSPEILEELGESADRRNGRLDTFDARCNFDVRNAGPDDLKQAWLQFVPLVKGKLGRGLTERLLTFVFHDKWARSIDLFRDEGILSLEDIEYNIENSARGMLRKGGFCEKRVQNPVSPDSSLGLYARSPLSVIGKQLEFASEVNSTFFFEPFTETSRFGDRVRGHPMSADLAREGYEAVKHEVMSSLDEDVCWVDGESFVAFLQIYSDASCMSLKTSAFSFYPLHISVLNASDAERDTAIRSGKTVSAYLPTAKMWPTAEQIRTGHARKYTVDGEPLTSYEADPLSAGAGSVQNDEVSNYKRVSPVESREILGESLKICLAELRDTAKKGFAFLDRDGRRRRAHFVIASYVADTPEVICVTCLTGGYCPRCRVEKSYMWKAGHVGERRMALHTEQSIAEFYRQAKLAGELPPKDRRKAFVEADRVLKDEGLTTRLPFNYDWPFSRAHVFFDPYRLMRVDFMHTFPLGIQKEILKLASLRLQSETLTTGQKTADGKPRTFKSCRNSTLSAANQYLRRIEEEAPAIALKVDFARGKSATATDGLFAESGVASMLEAKDFKNVAQVMPFLGALIDTMCAEDKNGAPVTAAFVKYTDLEAHLTRRGMHDKGHSDGDIDRLTDMIRDFKESTYKTFREYQATKFAFPKWHALEHIVSDIREMGRCSNFSADAYEQSHVGFKTLYRQGSQRKSTGLSETVSKIVASEAHRNSDTGDVDADMVRFLVHGERPVQYKKGLGHEATVSDACVLSTTRYKELETCFSEISQVVEGISQQMKTFGTDIHPGKSRRGCEHSRSSDLPAPNSFVAAVGGYALTKKVLDILRERYEHIGTTGVFHLSFHIVKSARVAGFQTPTGKDVLERSRGHPELFVEETGFRVAQKIVSALTYTGRSTPLQDNVLVEGDEDLIEMENGPKRRHMWVAKVLLFISVSRSGVIASSSAIPLGADGESSDDVAVVRYYQVISRNEHGVVDEELGCVKLRWAMDDKKEPWVDVIPASSIRGRVHVVPAPVTSFSEIGRGRAENAERRYPNHKLDGSDSEEEEPNHSQLEQETREGEAVFSGSHDWKQREFYMNRFRVNPVDKLYHTVDIQEELQPGRTRAPATSCD